MNVNERHLVFQWHPQMLWCHGLFFQVRSSTKWRRVDAYVYGTFGRADRAEFGQSDREPGVQYYVACLKKFERSSDQGTRSYENIQKYQNYDKLCTLNIWYIYNMYKYTDFLYMILYYLYCTHTYIYIHIDRSNPMIYGDAMCGLGYCWYLAKWWNSCDQGMARLPLRMPQLQRPIPTHRDQILDTAMGHGLNLMTCWIWWMNFCADVP